MSLLAIQIPARARPPARAAGDAVPATEFDYVLSANGRAVTGTGRATPSRLPKADSVVAVLADADVAWHLVTMPKAPTSRLRAALGGILEDALLDDDELLHLALPPRYSAGQAVWVAVVHKPWLSATLAMLEGSGLVVERVLPPWAPDGRARGHFSLDGSADGALRLALLRAEGAVTLRTAGTLARALLPATSVTVRWTATPSAAEAAERWLGQPVAVYTDAERALKSARSDWNLRQFDLAPRHRGLRAVRNIGRRFMSPEWRPVRWGVAAFAALQFVGLNVAAWQAQSQVDARKTAMGKLLQSSHPGVKLVYDAPVQMQRETDRLRAAAGRPGDGDLEVLLGAAAAAWPDGQGPVQTLRFESGRLILAAPGWGEPQLAQFRDRLKPAGLQVELAEGRVTVSRGNQGAA